jgi:hypothetical protein
LNLRDIQASRPRPTLAQGDGEVFLYHAIAAAHINQRCMRLHRRQETGIRESPRLGSRRQRQHYEVRFSESGVQSLEIDDF